MINADGCHHSLYVSRYLQEHLVSHRSRTPQRSLSTISLKSHTSLLHACLERWAERPAEETKMSISETPDRDDLSIIVFLLLRRPNQSNPQRSRTNLVILETPELLLTDTGMHGVFAARKTKHGEGTRKARPSRTATA